MEGKGWEVAVSQLTLPPYTGAPDAKIWEDTGTVSQKPIYRIPWSKLLHS
jgi:hypothetical protein